MVELQHYLGAPVPGQQIVATPGADTHVPLWILGSSLFGAQLAAMLGLPFSFASHFAPGMMMDALRVYRDNFKASDSLEKPYVMLGFNVCAADTAGEAEYLRSSSILSFLNLRKGAPRRLPPPVRDLERRLEPLDRALLQQMNSPVAVGDRDAVAAGLADFVAKTGADELMLVCSMYEHSKRVRSFEIAAEAAVSLDWQRAAAEA